MYKNFAEVYTNYLKSCFEIHKPYLELDEEKKSFHDKGLSKENSVLLGIHDQGHQLHCRMHKANCQRTLTYVLFLPSLGKRSAIYCVLLPLPSQWASLLNSNTYKLNFLSPRGNGRLSRLEFFRLLRSAWPGCLWV